MQQSGRLFLSLLLSLVLVLVLLIPQRTATSLTSTSADLISTTASTASNSNSGDYATSNASIPSSKYMQESLVVRVAQHLLRHDKPVHLALRHGDNIDLIFDHEGVCESEFLNEDLCELFKGKLAFDLYNNLQYYTSRSTSTVEDFYSTKIDVMRYLVRRYNYKSYLEIGCCLDENFESMKRILANHRGSDNTLEGLGSIIVGVDPYAGGTHRMTSDDWFSMNMKMNHINSSNNSNSNSKSNRNSIGESKSMLTFDLVLVDGLHHASQALRDILNSLNILNEGGTVLFHDANPNRYIYQVVPRPEDNPIWNGDVWKVVSVLRQIDDIEVVVLDIDHGVGIVRRRRNRHRLDPIWREKIQYSTINSSDPDYNPHQFVVRDYRGFQCDLDGIEWSDLYKNRVELLRLMSLHEMRAWLNSEVDRL
jgi:hypothetical protein